MSGTKIVQVRLTLEQYNQITKLISDGSKRSRNSYIRNAVARKIEADTKQYKEKGYLIP